ncbi:hypothetical protein ADT28_02150 [Xylella fastidiosa]|nr:hypothetical protein OY18_12685 [Xylella fastidiosa]ETE28965.1 hypothetical protein B398_12440 [Xylella fastidiosa 32]KXB22769.1 hypothetical protein ADT28_02150 [Xylella fastidiosa]NRP68847.1 hypothetical protein [Xylella fastidiosa]
MTRDWVHMEGRWCLWDAGISVGKQSSSSVDAVIQAHRLSEQPMWCCKHARNTTAPLHTHECVCLLGF